MKVVTEESIADPIRLWRFGGKKRDHQFWHVTVVMEDWMAGTLCVTVVIEEWMADPRG